MTQLLESLYQYVTEEAMVPYLAADAAYQQNVACGHMRRDRLMEDLTPEQKESLEVFWDEQKLIARAESTAIFRAALAVGLELGALGAGDS